MALQPLQLRDLQRARGISLDVLRAEAPQLADQIAPVVRQADGDRLVAALNLSDDVRSQIGPLDTSKGADDVISQLRTRLAALHVAQVDIDSIVQTAQQTASQIATTDIPGTQPGIARQIELTRVQAVSGIAGLDAATSASLSAAASSLGAIDDATLDRLVAAHTIDDTQAKAIGFSAALYMLADQDEKRATAIRGTSFARLDNKPPASTADLAALSPGDWTSFFTANPTLVPNDATPTAAGAAMAARLSALHPGLALSARLPRVATAQLGTQITSLATLFTHNEAVVGADFTTLDTTGVSAAQLDQLRTTQTNLRQVSNSYPGLQLASLMDDPARTVQDKAAIAARRVGYVQTAIAKLADTPLVSIDLSDGGADLDKLSLATLGAAADEQTMVLNTFRTYQRLCSLSGTVDDAYALASRGFDSALSIGRQHFAKFQSQSGLADDKARAVWADARMGLADATLSAGAIVDSVGGLFGKLHLNNQTAIDTELKKLAGFQDLFGSISFCYCEECQSILGPAAYFADLMKYIDENLRTQFAGNPDHPLDLKFRRPDLWTLELSCDNTNTRVPTLDIVDEVLENHVAKRLGFTGTFADRGAVGTLVYQQTLTQRRDSPVQPFHLPLARIASYLVALDVRWAEVADAVAAPVEMRVQAELGLSAIERQIVVTADIDLGHLGGIYGIAFSGPATSLADVDAAVLAPSLHLSRQQLGTLMATKFVLASGAIEITAAKRDANSVHNDIEWVSGLTAAALDRMHRFSRAVRRTTWSNAELDLVLAAIGATDLDASALENIAALHGIQRRFGLLVPELCALVGSLPQDPAGKSLFDSVFNPPSFVASDGAFPKPAAHFIHPGFRHDTNAPVDPAQPRLLTGLAVDLDGLASLARHLAPNLVQEAAPGFDPAAANDADRYFVLSAANLTLLYRHARLARLLKLTIDDLFQMLGLLGLDRVGGNADLLALLKLWSWWRGSSYQVDDVAVATGQSPRDTTRFPDPAGVAAAIAANVATALTFKGTVFAVALGTSEQASRNLVQANSAVIEAAGDDLWRLRAGVDLAAAALVIPPDATVPVPPAGARLVTLAELRGALLSHLAGEALLRSLGVTFNLTVAKVSALAALVGVSLTADPVVRAARGDGPLAPLTAVVAAIRPLATALAAAVWDADSIDFLRRNPTLFGTAPLPQTVADALHPNPPFVSLDQLRAISVYTRLAARRTGPAPDAPAVSPADIQAVLSGFQAGAPPTFPAATDAAMARALVVPGGLVVGLRGRMALQATAAPALDQLDRAAQLALTIGIDGETMGGLVSDDYATLSHAADALIAVLGARNRDEMTRATKLDLAEQPVREAKRDALAEYLIRSIQPRLWKSLDELYQYFLIDVDAGGCSTTSRVVAATMSTQLYVYRALMNLEQDTLPADDPQHAALRMPADAAAEWDWRRNYRVWQANREVFLWPENYLEPDLRDDKTPLFKDLEQELLQTDISDQNVLDAYTKYLAGFEELANLRIAGAYHDVAWTPIWGGIWGDTTGVNTSMLARIMPRRAVTRDVLHLFGAAASDPPTYYYRTCENLITSGQNPNTAAVWSPWQKVNVQITGRRVAPVVHLGRLHVFWTDVKTRSLNTVKDGASSFSGYQHLMTLKFTTLRPDGTWTAPQSVELPGNFGSGNFGPARGQIMDPRIVQTIIDHRGGVIHVTTSSTIKYDPQKRQQTEAIDDYTLNGPNWEGIWPLHWSIGGATGLELQFRNLIERVQVDLFDRRVFSLPDPWRTDAAPPYPQLLCAKKGTVTTNGDGTMPLFFGRPIWMAWPNPAYANAVIDERRLDIIELDAPGMKFSLSRGLYTTQIATIPGMTGLLAIPGSAQDGLLQIGNDILLMQGSVLSDGRYILRRLGTTLIHDIARRLFEDGVDSLLAIRTQSALAEAAPPISLVAGQVVDRTNTGKLDFTGPYGTYYRELFFHIPFLLANALNSRGRYAAAQRWYQYIFDPSATEVIDTTGVPPAEVAHRLLDRVWRYREFRGLDIEHLSDVLTDPAAIALYKRDPFNPWAIARRRISAFQKMIVMKYVDNLLDWADSLFSQFTMESVNEAEMLYVMAADILGTRPVELGDCGIAAEPKTYEHLGPMMDGSSEFLVGLETWAIGQRVRRAAIAPAAPPRRDLNWGGLAQAVAAHPLTLAALAPLSSLGGAAVGGTVGTDLVELAVTAVPGAARQSTSLFAGIDVNEVRTASWAPAGATARIKSRDKLGGRSFDSGIETRFPEMAGRFGLHLIRQITPVFCVPGNTNLLDYWDRVTDRLFKIRHCLDVDGNKRQLALFAPPISPMQLVAMRAAGLSLEDVLGVSNGNLPPYRFLYLVDRAKALAASLSGYGAAMLSAMEKRDGEDLNRLRLTQQMNMAQLISHTRQLEINAASESLEAINRQLEAAQYRSDFYANLVANDRSGWETQESLARHTASLSYLTESLIDGVAAILTATPDVGSPFAMKYGGVALGGSMSKFGNVVTALAEAAQAVASSLSLEGGFARRSEGWKNQKQLADYDVKSLTRQANAASIRLDIGNNALALHQKSIDQIQEMLDRTEGKFTNQGLYIWLSSQLQRLYRGAYQNALALAKLAEQAYRFERGDDTSPGLPLSYWDATHAGLLAGEKLLIDLQTLERRFLETNFRTLEIDQAFALSQVDPAALVSLRQTGECGFTIAEPYFDLAYPGHYKRRIKAVRLTIPSITGPYVNVSATLTLTGSWLRPSAQLDAPLVEVPPSRSIAVAASTAQNDAGVFELSFRDERYMPFEGLGAISQWSLSLPKAFRQFDYQTINDVIVSISYTAEQDGALRAKVEAQNAALEGSLVNFFSNTPARRLFSLRQDFSSAFTRMARSAAGTQVQIEFGDRNFPLFMQARVLQGQRAVLLLRTASGAPPNGFAITVDGTVVAAFAPDPTLGNLPAATLPVAFAANLRAAHTLTIQAAGDLAPTTPVPGDASAIDLAKLEDLLIYVEYKLT
jgi:Tc toxin complex TcA C-terminal TcB-binding domain/Neuraminidase-like domain/Salmonella virulence plasmid 28.1kDa A protein